MFRATRHTPSAFLPDSTHSNLSRFGFVLLLVGALIVQGCGGNRIQTTGIQGTPPDNLAYSQPVLAAILNQAITPDAPTVSGTVTSYNVSPVLPAGLSLNGANGVISGTPSAVAAKSSYTVTASNAYGSTSATVQVSVNSAPPSNLAYSQPQILATVNTAITPDTPTVTGTVESYAIVPALPHGLALDSGTGIISGTPDSNPAGLSPYTVTASNDGGSTSTTIQVGVSALAQTTGFAYPARMISPFVGQEITPDIPAVSGTITSFTISPALPAGLALDPATGIISGTPTASSPSTDYVVTGVTANGNVTGLNPPAISVLDAPTTLLQLGHEFSLLSLQMSSSRVLSQDGSHRWILWDYSSGAMLAGAYSGEARFTYGLGGMHSYAAQMAGPTIAIEVPGGFEMRSSVDGHILSTFSSPAFTDPAIFDENWQLASDGSYLAVETYLGVYVFSPQGQLLVSKTGYYYNPNPNPAPLTPDPFIFAAPGQLQIASGPEAPSGIETISVPGGVSTVSAPFQGSFQAWFTDGSHFVTSDGSTVWTYPASGAQASPVQIPIPVSYGRDWGPSTFGGTGNWLWTFGRSPGGNNNVVNVGAIDNSAPGLTDSTPDIVGYAASGATIGLIRSDGTLTVVDLSGQTIQKNDYKIPLPGAHAAASEGVVNTYAAASATQWVAEPGTPAVSYGSGLILDGASLASNTPRFLGGVGAALSISGGTNQVAIATAGGGVLLFSSATTSPEASIDLASAKVQLSADGSVLAASSRDETLLNDYLPPATTSTSSFSYSAQSAPGLLTDFTLSGSGNAVGQIETYAPSGTTTTVSMQLSVLSGSVTPWSLSPSPAPVLLSPDGTLAAFNVSQTKMSGSYTDLGVEIYQNGVLVNTGLAVGTVPGVAVGWIDNGRLLVNNYTNAPTGVYQGCGIYSPAGVLLAQPPLPELGSIQPLTTDTVYVPNLNAIYSLTTGQAVWTSPYPSDGIGAVAGSYVVFESQSRVIAVAY